jgi:Flp pilus assembly pilin Flp
MYRQLRLARRSALCVDDRGQATVEYTLLLAAFGIPLMVLFAAMLRALGQYFQMISLLETMPLP